MDDPEFYRAFEDRFRGSRELIKSRLEVYMPFIQPLIQLVDGKVPKALDLGCGRGEWLELLKEAGVEPNGVDTDLGMLAGCAELGLSVENKDALTALTETESESQLMVSAIHVAEHVEFNKLLDVVREAHRVLVPGGVMILETPNPENLIVSAVGFHSDPTHLKPLPPALLGFLAEYCGFSRHTILKLQEDKDILKGTEITLFKVFSASSRDYGIVAQKAGPNSFFEAIKAPFETSYGVSLVDIASSYDDLIAAELARQQAMTEELEAKFSKRIDEGEVRSSSEQKRLYAELSSQHEKLTSLCKQQTNDIANLKESLVQQRLRLDELHGKIANQTSGLEVRVSKLEASISQLSTDLVRILNTPVQRLLLWMSGKRIPDTDKNPDR